MLSHVLIEGLLRRADEIGQALREAITVDLVRMAVGVYCHIDHFGDLPHVQGDRR